MTNLTTEALKAFHTLNAFAAKDPDTASMVASGTSVEDSDKCIIIVKGNQATRWLYDLLVKQKLLTPGKGIR
jgi:hypothetical protein